MKIVGNLASELNIAHRASQVSLRLLNVPCFIFVSWFIRVLLCFYFIETIEKRKYLFHNLWVKNCTFFILFSSPPFILQSSLWGVSSSFAEDWRRRRNFWRMRSRNIIYIFNNQKYFSNKRKRQSQVNYLLQISFLKSVKSQFCAFSFSGCLFIVFLLILYLYKFYCIFLWNNFIFICGFPMWLFWVFIIRTFYLVAVIRSVAVLFFSWCVNISCTFFGSLKNI